MTTLNPTLSDMDHIARIKNEISSLEKAIESLKKKLTDIPDMGGAEKMLMNYLSLNVDKRIYHIDPLTGIRWEDKDPYDNTIMSLDNNNLLNITLPPSLQPFDNEFNLSKDDINVVIKNVITNRYGIHFEGIWLI